MQWLDEAIILSVRKYGENAAILEVMTREHGRHMGLVHGAASRRLRPILQIGNQVKLNWRARLDEHLGVFKVEDLHCNVAGLFSSSMAMAGLQTMAAHLHLLAERDPHIRLYEETCKLIGSLDNFKNIGELFVRFEILLLDEFGYGLDLSRCVASGSVKNLIYVSPKSGCAVSREAGEAYAKKMLPLPAFLRSDESVRTDFENIKDGLRISELFLLKRIYLPRGLFLPQSRINFINSLSEF